MVCNVGKYDIHEVKNILNDRGFKLISKKYINSKSKIIVVDRCGYLYYSTLDNIKKNKFSTIVNKDNPLTLRNIRTYIRVNNLPCELLSLTYTGTNEKMLFKCKCGRLFNSSWNKLLNAKKYLCNKCALKTRGFNHRISYEKVQNDFALHEYKLLTNSYVNIYNKMPCEDKNGYRGLLSYQGLQSGYDITPFSINNPFLFENINRYIDLNGYKCKLLTNTTKGYRKLSDIPLKFLCECGNIYDVIWRSFTYQEVTRCPIYSRKKSKYAYLTEQLLSKYNLKYQSEFSFPGCRDKRNLRFDYAIFKEDKIYLLEVDGQFHYYDIYGMYIEQQRRDNIKNQFCSSNNIPLIRIPYWEFERDTYIKTITEGLKIQSQTH